MTVDFDGYQYEALDLMRKYHHGYSTETSLLQTYRGIFLALEAILFAGTIALIQLCGGGGNVNEVLMYVVAGIGVLFLLLWGIVCEGRSRRAEKWRTAITELDVGKNPNTPEANFIELSKKGWSIEAARYCLNMVMPVALFIAWGCVWWLGVKGF